MYTEDYTGEIGTEDKDWYWEIGFIAQDIEKIPYLEFAVSKPENDTEGKYGLNYTHFIGVCLQGIKDLHNRHQPEIAKVATLQTDVDREKLKTLNLQERILVMEQAYHALLERVSDLENS